MNYAHKKFKNQIWDNKQKLAQNQYVSISKQELIALIGSDPKTIRNSLAATHRGQFGYFLPNYQNCPTDYLTGVVLSTQSVYKRNEVVEPTIPNSPFFSLDYLIPEVSKYREVLQFLPERWHIKGEKRGQMIIEDRSFVYAMFATTLPVQFNQFFDRQSALQKAELEKNNPNNLQVSKELVERLKLRDNPIYSKGKAGAMIVNKQKTRKLKRKREDAIRETVHHTMETDKVWLPPKDLENQEEPHLLHEYVKIDEYNSLRARAKTINKKGSDFTDAFENLPLNTAVTFNNLSDAQNAYNITRNSVMNQLKGYNFQIDTWEGAVAKHNVTYN